MSEAPAFKPVGEYRIVEPISHGATGVVYRALDSEDRELALKRLVHEGARERCEIEARLLSGLSHPRVVEVLGHVRDDDADYLVMELVRGIDLGRVVNERGSPGLPIDRALEYACQACEAVQYVHDQQIIHRDVKPQNLILSEDRGVVLVDFGIARRGEVGDGGTRGVGTPKYMAPEVLVGESVSPRSDVFGLAATAWAMITGSPPSYRDARVLSEEFDDVTPELERSLRSGLELHPERRFGSAEAFAAAIGTPLGMAGGQSLSASLPGPDHQRALLEAIVRTAAGVFEAAATSLALVDRATGELVYQAAWGAGAEEIVGVRLDSGQGIAGEAQARGEAIVVTACRGDERFAPQIASGTGYVPYTLLAIPLLRGDDVIGVLSILDRRDGLPFEQGDVPRASLFAELALAAIPG